MQWKHDDLENGRDENYCEDSKFIVISALRGKACGHYYML